MSKEKQIESTDWLTRDIPKEQLEQEKQEAIMSTDLGMCHTEFETGVGEIYTDYDETSRKMFAKGYRKQEWISVDERLPNEAESVLAYGETGICFATRYEGDWLTPMIYPGELTHWMPLPEPPMMKGGAEE